ncbi:MAG: YvcK family protein [Clostridia bacterium]|nr:YvcK family protein [Clostridia bacterium]
MKVILEWLKPGAHIKRYLFIQLISIILAIFCIVTLFTTYDIDIKKLIAYVFLVTIALFGIIFSFIIAQKNILALSLKNISGKEQNINLKKLLYSNNALKKGPKIVMIGGGSGLSNILRGLKEHTSNITAIVTTFDDGGSTGKLVKEMDVLAPGDIRKCIAALSTSEATVERLLTYRFRDGHIDNHSLGNLFIVAMTDITGSFANAVEKISEIFKIRGKVLPVTLDKMKLCAGLDNGEVVVGEDNIPARVREIKSPIKQIFLKEGSCKPAPEVIESIKDANIIVIGPGSLYTSVACNLLVDEVSRAIIQSKAKKVFIANLMNQPGETDGYTLSKHVNEIERYIGKHVLDYCIANDGEITEEMIKDFNQGNSTPVKNDLENIQNRAISVIEDDLVLTAPNSILHDSERIAQILMSIAKSKKIGDLNIVKVKKKHLKKEKKLINGDNIGVLLLKNIKYKISKKSEQLSKNNISKVLSDSKSSEKTSKTLTQMLKKTVKIKGKVQK